jgi:aminoglycoside phosphotransferase (APT) family kinase protein
MVPEEDPIEHGGIPPAEVDIDERLVRGLLRSQHPDLAGLPLRHVATGWDNVTYRLGGELAVRLPRISAAASLIALEQRWLPWLAGHLPVAVPVPLRHGGPGDGFSWPWSIVPWMAGRTVDREPLNPDEAGLLGRFLASLHLPPPAGFPRNGYRGIPLASLSEPMEPKFAALAASGTGLAVPAAAVRDVWQQAVAAPLDAADKCIHGDLHPRNLVASQGRLAAVLDWGDMTAGDPATDLAAAWLLFPAAAHGALWAAYGHVSVHTMTRARGWAVFFGTTQLTLGLDSDPVLAGIGRRTLERACTS